MSKLFRFALIIPAFFLFMTACQKEEIKMETQDVQINADLESGAIIPGQYIVVFKSNTMPSAPVGDYGQTQQFMQQQVTGLLNVYEIPASQINHVYGTALQGFAAKLTGDQLRMLEGDERIDYIEPDRTMVIRPYKGKPGGGGGGGV